MWPEMIMVRPDCINCQNHSFTWVYFSDEPEKKFNSILSNSTSNSTGKVFALLGLYILGIDKSAIRDLSLSHIKPNEQVVTTKGKLLVPQNALEYLAENLSVYSRDDVKNALVFEEFPNKYW